MTTTMDNQPPRREPKSPKQRRLRRYISQFLRSSPSADFDSTGFLVDGDERLRLGVEAAARAEVEPLYEMSLKNANSVERQRLLGEMESAIEKRIQELMPSVSPETLF